MENIKISEDVYKIYNSKVVDFIRSPKGLTTDKNLEAFYELIDELEKLAKEELKDYFVPAQTGEKCCICGKENIDFYVGYAYEDGKLIVFSADRERFCSDCLVTGRATREKNIIFNNELIQDETDMSEEQRHTLLYCTPGVSHNFDTNEDIWPVCCEDYCCYMGNF